MKKFIYIILIVLSLSYLTACGEKTSNPSAKELSDSIITIFDTNSMSEITSDRISSYYDIDLTKVIDYSIYIEGSGGSADEVAVFKAKSSNDISSIKASINDRIARRQKDFENYNSEELVKIEDNLVLQKGDYILFVISDNNDKAESIFKEHLK